MTINNFLAVFIVSAIATGTLATRAIESKPATKEKVVEVKSAIATTRWFEVDITNILLPLNPESQLVDGEGSSIPFCEESSGTICEVELDVSVILTSNPSYQFEGKTVQELLDAGAKYTLVNPFNIKVPNYTYRL